MPFAENVELVAYHALGDRPGFKLAMQERAGRFFLYVCSLWEPGWSILDVTDPASPELLRWVPGPPGNTETTQVQVADGRLITPVNPLIPDFVAKPLPGTPPEGIIIWDVEEPDNPRELGRWETGARGVHRCFYAGGRYVHTATTLPGYEGYVYGALDIADPTDPRLVGKWWWPGQHTAGGEKYDAHGERALETGLPFHLPRFGRWHSLSLHGGAYVVGDRAYCPWMRGGLVILDITNVTSPTLVSTLPVYPPLGTSIAVHSAVPIPSRDLVIINSEALAERCEEPVNFVGLVDVSAERDPVLISLFPQPRAPKGYTARSFCEKGGKFGPHNQHQPQGMPWLLDDPDHVYLTYFNAGVQVYDISDPRDPFIAGFYIPDDPVKRYGPVPADLVPQCEDLLVDRRGFVYVTDKNWGLHVLRFDGS